MKFFQRGITLIIAILIFVATFDLNVFAVSGYYETAKDNVPVWSEASSKSTKITTVSNKGTVFYITSSTVNSSNNLWYKTSSGSWIYSQNMIQHTHSYSGGICSKCNYEWPYTVNGASGTYVASNSEGTKIWSRPYSNNSTLVKTLSYGTKISIIGQTTNQAGNLWYKTSEGYWVYSGNVSKDVHTHTASVRGEIKNSSYTVKDGTYHNVISIYDEYCSCGQVMNSNVQSITQETHSYSGGICSKCNYEWPYTVNGASGTYIASNSEGTKIWSRPYSNNSTLIKTLSYGTKISIIGQTTNQAGNLWYKTSEGSWVYSGNVNRDTHTHSFSGGICDECDYEWPYTVNSASGTYIVSNPEGAKIWNRPYSKKSNNIKTLNFGTKISIIGQTTNQAGNLWYKTSEGYWVYSENVKKAVQNQDNTIHVHDYSFTNTTSVYFEQLDKTYHNVISVYDVLCSCGVIVESGQKVSTKREHNFSGGICSDCGYEWPYSLSSLSGTYMVSNSEGAKIWSRPYSNNSTIIRVEPKGAMISIIGKTKNQAGHLWYKTTDGYWVYSENVETHKHQGSVCGQTKDTKYSKKNSTYHTVTSTYDEYCSCGAIVNENKQSKTEEKHNFSGDICVDCGYKFEAKFSTVNKTMYTTKNSVPLRNNYYNKNSEVIKTLNVDTPVKVVKSVENAFRNIWYQTEDGYYVYGENLTSEKPKTYTISFDANDGTDAPEAFKVTENSAPRIPTSPIPKRSGYNFVGWSTSKSAKEAEYQPGASLPQSKNITLYAVWKWYNYDGIDYQKQFCQVNGDEHSGLCNVASTANLLKRKARKEGIDANFTIFNVFEGLNVSYERVEDCSKHTPKREAYTTGKTGGTSIGQTYTDTNKKMICRTKSENINNKEDLKKLIDDHPEGVYVRYPDHAIVVTRYEGDQFYVIDPAKLLEIKIPLEQAKSDQTEVPLEKADRVPSNILSRSDNVVVVIDSYELIN